MDWRPLLLSVNQFSPFLLINLLLAVIQASPSARMIDVSFD
jgi:hypothetical protein